MRTTRAHYNYALGLGKKNKQKETAKSDSLARD